MPPDLPIYMHAQLSQECICSELAEGRKPLPGFSGGGLTPQEQNQAVKIQQTDPYLT